MTEVLIDDVDEVITVTKSLIKSYLEAKKRFKNNGMGTMSNSANGSVIGLIRLLSMITDKSAEEYFIEFGVMEAKKE